MLNSSILMKKVLAFPQLILFAFLLARIKIQTARNETCPVPQSCTVEHFIVFHVVISPTTPHCYALSCECGLSGSDDVRVVSDREKT